MATVAALVTVGSLPGATAAPAPGCTALPVVAGIDPLGSAPVISADGNHVLYASEENIAGGNPDGSQELWVVDLRTGTTTQLTDRPGYAKAFVDLAIDGDGDTFAYLSGTYPPNREAHLVQRSPRSDRLLGAADGWSIRLSANAKRVAYTSRRGLVVRNNVTGVKTLLAGTGSAAGGFDATGKRFVFTSGDDLVGQNGDGNREAYVRRFGTSPSTTQVTDTPAENFYDPNPTFTGDGSMVVYTGHDQTAPEPRSTVEVYRYDMETGLTDQVTSAGRSTISDETPAVNRDGSVIMFAARGDVGGLDLQGGDIVRLITATGEYTNLTREPEYLQADRPSVDDAGTTVVYSRHDLFDNHAVAGLACPLPAPRPTVSGVVTDSSSGAPVPGAWVMAVNAVGELTAGAIAAQSGSYSMTVPVGTYKVQTIDPSGRHRGEWYDDQGLGGFDAAQPVTPTITGPVRVDAALDPAGASGAIVGTVADADTGDPIDGALVAALGPTGEISRGAVADAAGHFAIEGLLGADYRVSFIDPTGGHEPELHLDASTFPDAATVAVTPGVTSTVDAGLVARPLPPAESTIRGRVSDPVTGFPGLDWVLAFDETGTFVRAAEASFLSPGHFDLDLPVGTYKLQFLDRLGLHAGEWYEDHGLDGFADADVVTTEADTTVTIDTDLSPAGPSGEVAGIVRDSASDTPLPGVWVGVVDTGSGAMVGSGVTDGHGEYTVGSLRAGAYVVAFVDPAGAHGFEFHEDTVDFAAATSVAVMAGATTTVDAGLAPRL